MTGGLDVVVVVVVVLAAVVVVVGGVVVVVVRDGRLLVDLVVVVGSVVVVDSTGGLKIWLPVGPPGPGLVSLPLLLRVASSHATPATSATSSATASTSTIVRDLSVRSGLAGGRGGMVRGGIGRTSWV